MSLNLKELTEVLESENLEIDPLDDLIASDSDVGEDNGRLLAQNCFYPAKSFNEINIKSISEWLKQNFEFGQKKDFVIKEDIFAQIIAMFNLDETSPSLRINLGKIINQTFKDSKNRKEISTSQRKVELLGGSKTVQIYTSLKRKVSM